MLYFSLGKCFQCVNLTKTYGFIDLKYFGSGCHGLYLQQSGSPEKFWETMCQSYKIKRAADLLLFFFTNKEVIRFYFKFIFREEDNSS